MNFFQFALINITRNFKNFIGVFVFFALFVFIASGVIFSVYSIQNYKQNQVKNSYEIQVVNKIGGYFYPIDLSVLDDVLMINGIENIKIKINGIYQSAFATINVVSDKNVDNNTIAISKNLHKKLKKFFFIKDFNFITKDGIKKLKISKIFDDQSFLNQTLKLNPEDARDVFGYDEDEASVMYLDVPNKSEVYVVVEKLQAILPTATILTKEDRLKMIDKKYDFKSGIVLSIFTLSFLTFLVIFYNAAMNGLKTGRKNIGILRAIGWSINDVLKFKFFESVITSLGAFFVGVVLAYFYTFKISGNIFVKIFVDEKAVDLDAFLLKPDFDIKAFVLLFFIIIIPYLASSLYPSYKSAVIDPNEAMR